MSSHQRADGDQAVKEQAFVIGSLIAHRNPQRFTAVRARRLDPPVPVQGGADAECIPGTVPVPPPSGRLNTVGGGDTGERVRHPDLVGRQVQNERVLGVEPIPAGPDLRPAAAANSGNLGRPLARGRARRSAQVRLRNARSSSFILRASSPGIARQHAVP
jgi:hypothetical protein